MSGGVSTASAFLLHKNEAQLVGCCLPIDVVVRVTNRMIAEEVTALDPPPPPNSVGMHLGASRSSGLTGAACLSRKVITAPEP